MVIALKASQAAQMRAATGISSPASPSGIAAAVPALVRGADDAADAREQAADLLEHALALDRVGLHDRPLLVVQRAGLVDDLVGHGDLADVVQQRAHLGLAPRVLVEAHLVGDLDRQLDDVLGVVAGVLVVLLEQVAQEQRGAAVGAAELEARAAIRPSRSRSKPRSSGISASTSRASGRLVGGRERRQQADRREQDVDALGHAAARASGRGSASPCRPAGPAPRRRRALTTSCAASAAT